MRIPLDRTSTVPLHRQISSWLRQAIDDGHLPSDHRLPSTRRLAAELGVSRSTVVAAYNHLESTGVLVTREGSGTRVAPHVEPVPPSGGAGRRAPRSLGRRPAGGGRPADVTVHDPSAGVISFTGVGDPRMFPVADLSRTLRDVLRHEGGSALGYGSDPRGDPGLRRTVAQMLATQGIVVDPDSIVITNGSQQALALACQTVLRPRDCVVVEDPTYDNALALFRVLNIEVVPVATDSSGLQVDALERALQQHRVGLVYTMPTFQNPTGATLTSQRRHALLDAAQQYGVPIFEDDFAADLRYDGRAVPALKALDRHGLVLYAGTFSKLIAPAVRVGFIVAEEPLLGALVRLRNGVDLGTSVLMQRTLDRHVSAGRYQASLRRTIRVLRRRRDALHEELSTRLPGVRAQRPNGGLFTWVRLPAGLTADGLLPIALAHGVEVASGTRFLAGGMPSDHVRLNFAVLSATEIRDGVTRLARAVEVAGGQTRS